MTLEPVPHTELPIPLTTREQAYDLLRLVAQGVVLAHAARQLGITYASILSRRRTDAEFADLLEAALAESAADILQAGMERAKDGDLGWARQILPYLMPEEFGDRTQRVEVEHKLVGFDEISRRRQELERAILDRDADIEDAEIVEDS